MRESLINIFSLIVTLEEFDGILKDILYHGYQSLKMSENFSFAMHGVNPSISGKFISKENIIFETTNRRSG